MHRVSVAAHTDDSGRDGSDDPLWKGRANRAFVKLTMIPYCDIVLGSGYAELTTRCNWESDMAVKQSSTPPCQRVAKTSKPTINYMIYQELLGKSAIWLQFPP
jgi:hypothetical protein